MKTKYPKYLEKGMQFDRLTVIEVDESNKYNENGKRTIPFLGRFINKEYTIEAGKETEEKYYGEFSYDNSMKRSTYV